MSTAGTSKRDTYVSLWVFALAFGFVEACVVVYLRDLYLRDAALSGPGIGLQVTQVALPLRVVRLEFVRESCTMLVLAAVGWMASRRLAGRIGAFLVGFGVWDLMYYAVLWLVIAWPDSLYAWDILFLIPVPWVAPVWAPIFVATLFVIAGSYLFFTDERARSYRWIDAVVVVAAALVIVGSFLVESRAAAEHRVPRQFPGWLYWSGVALGAVWVARIERAVWLRTTRLDQ